MPYLESLLQAGASVAVVGARDDTSTYGGRAWTYLTRAFQGTATAVNARTGAVRSRRCVATLAEVDPAPEAVVLATPADTVIGLLEQAGAMGTSAAVIFSRDLFGSEEQIRAVAGQFGMSVLGPNCLGLINTNAGVILSSSISLERPSRPGPLAFVSQSGALMGLLHARSIDLGLGMGMCVSTGSQAVLRAEDFLLELAGRDDVGAVGVYLESIDVPGFTAAAEALAQRDIRLIALRAGSTSAGSRAATAHSGALAGSGEAFTALARDLGVVVVDDPGELLTTLALASSKGRRWHITTSSGGMAAIAADQATALGVELPPVRAVWRAPGRAGQAQSDGSGRGGRHHEAEAGADSRAGRRTGPGRRVGRRQRHAVRRRVHQGAGPGGHLRRRPGVRGLRVQPAAGAGLARVGRRRPGLPARARARAAGHRAAARADFGAGAGSGRGAGSRREAGSGRWAGSGRD